HRRALALLAQRRLERPDRPHPEPRRRAVAPHQLLDRRHRLQPLDVLHPGAVERVLRTEPDVRVGGLEGPARQPGDHAPSSSLVRPFSQSSSICLRSSGARFMASMTRRGLSPTFSMPGTTPRESSLTPSRLACSTTALTYSSRYFGSIFFMMSASSRPVAPTAAAPVMVTPSGSLL